MGGAIGVRSEVGRGTTFWIELPRTLPDHGEVRRREPVMSMPARAAASGTILYVEDNPANVRLMERVLARRDGARLLTAGSGALGIEIARDRRPDLIFLDLHLPDMPGEDVLRRLWADESTRQIPIAVLSADAMPSQAQRMLSAGAIAYLTKPLDIARVLQLVDERLGTASAVSRKQPA
jgi:CheY-like chemotaxis protein